METQNNVLEQETEVVDVRINRQGTISVVIPVTDAGKEFIEDRVSFESYQMWGNGIVVEHRYIDDLVQGMRNDGLVVEEV